MSEGLRDCARPVLPVQQFVTWFRQHAGTSVLQGLSRPSQQFFTCLWPHAGTSWTKRMRWQTVWPSCGRGAWLPLVLHSPSRLATATGVALSKATAAAKLVGKQVDGGIADSLLFAWEVHWEMLIVCMPQS